MSASKSKVKKTRKRPKKIFLVIHSSKFGNDYVAYRSLKKADDEARAIMKAEYSEHDCHYERLCEASFGEASIEVAEAYLE